MSKDFFKDLLSPLVENFEEDKKELCSFIQDLDQDEFAELMDVLSSIMMDPLAIGDEDDSSKEIEGDEKIIDMINDGTSTEEISKALEESEANSLEEKVKVSAAERLKAAKEKKRDPRIKKMNKIKNAWRKKCAKRKLKAQKQESGKWGCGSVNHALSLLAKRYANNRQKAIKA